MGIIMKNLLLSYSLLFITLFNYSIAQGQGFRPPEKGKAVIYFVHLKKKDAFEYFHNDTYIGIIKKGKNYLRLEFKPGEHLLWGSAENKEFITADLKEGGTYIVIGKSKMGMWSARCDLFPITEQDEMFDLARSLINEKEPITIPQSEIIRRNKELVLFIENIMDHYETEWKHTQDFPYISAEMAIPPDQLN